MQKREAFLVGKNRSFYTLGEYNTLGSADENSLRLAAENVAERHARIELRPEGALIRDLRSSTGTWVNGTRVSEAWLNDSDLIRIGDEDLVFLDEKPGEDPGIGLRSKNENWNAHLATLGPVARTDFPILLLGPSGTGKEVLAEALHRHSLRAKGPFVRVNCSALTETLIESELFGHIKGSFTGAVNDRKGAFETARGGTLFLDEIGDLPYGLQAKLLRALENNEIRPVGADRTIQTDVRIIAATQTRLPEKIMSGEFRNDLYYRLSVLTLTPPALTDRMEDFEDLLYHFAKQMRVRFSHTAIQRLKKHTWPGNIRELRNTVARACAFFPKQSIEETHIERIMDPYSLRQSAGLGQVAPVLNAAPLPVIKEIEKQMIIKRLAANNGNQRRTAADLGMPKSTLHDRLRLYKIDARAFEPQAQNSLADQ